MKKIFLLSALFIFASLSIAAQEPAPIKQVNGGVLNGKAKSLVRPAFPAAARAVRASGAVSVQVLIDEQGNVASATAVSGHPLLRQASEQAALASKFSPTTLSGQPVKVAGIIVYNFVPETTPKSFGEIGFDLGILEKSKEVPNDISTFSITSNLPNDWTEEKEMFTNFYKRAEVPLNVSEVPPSSSNSGVSDSKIISTGPLRVDTVTVQGTRDYYSSERPKISAEIIGKIENRLSSNPNLLWKFQTGTTLGRITAQIENISVIAAEASILNDLIAAAPNETLPSTVESLRKLVEFIQSNDATLESKITIKMMAQKLKNL